MKSSFSQRHPVMVFFFLLILAGSTGAPTCSGKQVTEGEKAIAKYGPKVARAIEEEGPRIIRTVIRSKIARDEITNYLKHGEQISPKVAILLSHHLNNNYEQMGASAVRHATQALSRFMTNNPDIDEFVKNINNSSSSDYVAEKLPQLENEGKQLIRLVKKGAGAFG